MTGKSNHMKKLMLVIAMAAGICAADNLEAQTNTTENFFQTAAQWGTSFNTNLTWVGTQYELAVGADFQNGVQWANHLELKYDVSGGDFSVGAEMLNAGIAGTVEAYEAEAGWAFLNEYDLRGELTLGAGYNHQYNCGLVEPKVGLRKKMTATTFAGIFLSVPCMFGAHNVPNQWTPSVGIETGVCGGNVVTTPALSLHTHGSRLVYRVGNVLNKIGDGVGGLFCKRGNG